MKSHKEPSATYRNSHARRFVGGEYIQDFEISNTLGLHARPAAEFVKKASAYSCEVGIENMSAGNHKRVNGKSIMGILTLGAEYGATVRCYTKGKDAEK